MKSAQAISRFLRVPPRKARLAADLIRNKHVLEAQAQLECHPSKASIMICKTLKSAVANLDVKHGVNKERMTVSEIRIDEGPRLKRGKSKAKGGRVPILKKMSHVTVVVSEVV